VEHGESALVAEAGLVDQEIDRSPPPAGHRAGSAGAGPDLNITGPAAMFTTGTERHIVFSGGERRHHVVITGAVALLGRGSS